MQGSRVGSPVTVECRDISPRYTRLVSLVLWATPLEKTILNCFFFVNPGGAPRPQYAVFFCCTDPLLRAVALPKHASHAEQLHSEGILPCEEMLLLIDD